MQYRLQQIGVKYKNILIRVTYGGGAGVSLDHGKRNRLEWGSLYANELMHEMAAEAVYSKEPSAVWSLSSLMK